MVAGVSCNRVLIWLLLILGDLGGIIPYSMGKDVEAQRDSVPFPRSHSKEGLKLSYQSGFV